MIVCSCGARLTRTLLVADRLTRFRGEFYRCLSRRADALFELTDALLCAGGPVTSLVDLTLVAEHRRGHGALYDGCVFDASIG